MILIDIQHNVTFLVLQYFNSFKVPTLIQIALWYVLICKQLTLYFAAGSCVIVKFKIQLVPFVGNALKPKVIEGCSSSCTE